MTYHWILTLQEQLPNGDLHIVTQHGTYGPQEGETRKDVYEKIRAHVASETRMSSPSVLFFSLEPNTLGGAS